MKTVLFATALTLLAASLVAQTPNTNGTAPAREADLRRQAPENGTGQLMSLVNFQTTTTSRILGLRLNVDGALPRLLKTDRPLQILSPFAPASYGSGYDNVVYNPGTRRGEGIAFLRFKF